MGINYSIIIKSNHWPRRVREIKKIVKKIFKCKKNLDFNSKLDYYCNIVLINDLYMKKLNKKYKKINKATDVLTFVSEIKNQDLNEKHCDIMIAAETAFNDSKIKGINFYNHLSHLIIHSILHINGYSHSNNNSFSFMKKKEINILKDIGIANPYL